MLISSVTHKGLRRLIEDDDARGLDARAVPKLRRMLSFLAEAAGVEELHGFPLWRVHQLTGDREGVWSLAVTRNYRLTFRIDDGNQISQLDFEDYH